MREMKDEDKTREQLIGELVQLRKRIAELEELYAARRQLDKQPLRIGEILMEMGHVTQSQLEEALQKQKEFAEQGQGHTRLASVMFKLGFINADQMRTALEVQETRIHNARLESRRLQDEIRRWNR